MDCVGYCSSAPIQVNKMELQYQTQPMDKIDAVSAKYKIVNNSNSWAYNIDYYYIFVKVESRRLCPLFVNVTSESSSISE